MSTHTVRPFYVSTTLADEGMNPARPFIVTSSPYGETITRDFPTADEAIAYAASVAEHATTAPDYLTSWGMSPVNGHATITHYLDAVAPAPDTLDGVTPAHVGAFIRILADDGSVHSAGVIAEVDDYLVTVLERHTYNGVVSPVNIATHKGGATKRVVLEAPCTSCGVHISLDLTRPVCDLCACNDLTPSGPCNLTYRHTGGHASHVTPAS